MKKITLLSIFIIFLNLENLQAQNDLATLNQNNFAHKSQFFKNFSSVLNKKKISRLVAPTDKSVFVDFVGSGDIQKSISEGKEINANTGIGIIFEEFYGDINEEELGLKRIMQSLEVEATINIATTADTIFSSFNNDKLLTNRRDFGTYILNPISARQSLFINSNAYFGYPDNLFGKITSVISGINIRIISSNNVWVFKEKPMNLGVLAFRAGIFHEFFPDNFRLTDEGRSKYSLFLGANYAYRGIFGDISSKGNKELRKEILGTDIKSFHGIEINFGFRLNNLRAEFQMPILKKQDNNIEGLTNTQFQFSIRFVGGFALKLNKTNESE